MLIKIGDVWIDPMRVEAIEDGWAWPNDDIDEWQMTDGDGAALTTLSTDRDRYCATGVTAENAAAKVNACCEENRGRMQRMLQGAK